MSTATVAWQPINEHPGDQRLDRLPTSPDTPDVSYFAEVGRETDGWSWTVIAVTDDGSADVDSGHADTESGAKAHAESWTPAQADPAP